MILLAGCVAEIPPQAAALPPPDAAVPVDLAPYSVAFDGSAHLLEPAHSRAELLRRRLELGAELPALSVDERARVLPRIDILALVSVTEGAFDGVATHPRDPLASLGIFQWAGERKRAVSAGSSLARFFVALEHRARGCEETPSLSCAAWKQCGDVGVTLRAGALLLHGKPATGAQLVGALGVAFGTGALRAYQLVAATDWVEQIAATKIDAPAGTTSVAALLPSARGLALAVLLGVNRPAYVAPSLSEAVGVSPGATEPELISAFRAAALSRYPAPDRERRAVRLLTAELLAAP